MFDAATAPAEARHPDPPDRAVPPRLGKLLGLVHTLIAYGRNLTSTLQQHAADPRALPWFIFVASMFSTTEVAPMLARIARGLLRAAALEERLQRRAARGQELKVAPVRLPQRKLQTPTPAIALPHDPAPEPSEPALEQILAHDRRRSIGAVLVGICLDLGIAPGQMDHASSEELTLAIILYGGNLRTLIFNPERRQPNPAAIPDISLPSDITGEPIIVFPPRPAPSTHESPLPLREGVRERGPDP